MIPVFITTHLFVPAGCETDPEAVGRTLFHILVVINLGQEEQTRGLSAYKACSRFSSVIILVKIYT